MSPDATVLEVATVRVTEEQSDDFDAIWEEIDEQFLPIDVRRSMAANGFRVGLSGAQLPDFLRQSLDGDATSTEQNLYARQKRLQSRNGRRSVIMVDAQPRSHVAVLFNEGGGVTGETYHNARCLFGVKTFAANDGRVRLELTPEVQHGQPRTTWTGQDGAFRLNTEQASKTFDNFRMTATLSPGQTLLLTCTPDFLGLGHQFFGSDERDVRQRLLLIRIAQTQLDDLFSPEFLAED